VANKLDEKRKQQFENGQSLGIAQPHEQFEQGKKTN
jgi:hypothetical protein